MQKHTLYILLTILHPYSLDVYIYIICSLIPFLVITFSFFMFVLCMFHVCVMYIVALSHLPLSNWFI